jgi:hypothetical protein
MSIMILPSSHLLGWLSGQQKARCAYRASGLEPELMSAELLSAGTSADMGMVMMMVLMKVPSAVSQRVHTRKLKPAPP